MQTPFFNRRSAIGRTLAACAAVVTGTRASADSLTPPATEGPFYPTPAMRMPDVDNDLVKVMGLVQEAGGEVITLRGRVLDADGGPLPGLRVEIWQCDVNGKYMHPGDRRDIAYDTGFQGFGHDITGDDGAYSFRTIRPTEYPGRTPHIHVKVFDDGAELLTTQFYLPDHPANARDRIYNQLSDAEKTQVTMFMTDGADGPETTVDIVV
ncbi:protocatechuate 3,4-dioxygenase [Loktanella sp. 3ANDIMAR09]|uniref:dioxygenase family protein n=1 Tax=Loktanella sp. 3ANDIMAR09 TaxID=1225657 RepID=UPI0006FBF007|nr:protocatechuate 3,4-dioxygenase [Loktanella sp. 3ANDIMAR09]KQI68800.1 protocatechuate 3,4-dioxygenase [Loktanella sp. 3ANDIMAR09]